MIPEHVIVLATILCVAWALVRWGAILFTLYALARFWVGEWGEAALALGFACLIDHVKAYASWIHWNAEGRDAWLKRRRTRFR